MKKTLLILLILVQVAVAQAQRPTIGISCSWSASKISVLNTYITSVIKAGGLPVVIPLSDNEELLSEYLDGIDALIMTGGEDYNPLLFGEEPVQALGEVSPDRDFYDLTLIKKAIEKGVPLLGICRGMQGINIAFGGTLYQDIPSTYGNKYIKHEQSLPGKWGSHTISIDKNSLLYEILGTEKTIVGSRHHQSVNKLAPGFTVTSRATDGIVEAMEKRDGKAVILGVQFHPEDMTAGGDTQMLKIFEYLIKQAQKK